jgi:hypothetical protein
VGTGSGNRAERTQERAWYFELHWKVDMSILAEKVSRAF